MTFELILQLFCRDRDTCNGNHCTAIHIFQFILSTRSMDKMKTLTLSSNAIIWSHKFPRHYLSANPGQMTFLLASWANKRFEAILRFMSKSPTFLATRHRGTFVHLIHTSIRTSSSIMFFSTLLNSGLLSATPPF